jgi:hypothetical protein
MANDISQRIEHTIWEVHRQQPDEVIGGFHASDEFMDAVLARLTPEDHTAYVREAVSFAIASDLEDIFDDGCGCEEHLAQNREAAAIAR